MLYITDLQDEKQTTWMWSMVFCGVVDNFTCVDYEMLNTVNPSSLKYCDYLHAFCILYSLLALKEKVLQMHMIYKSNCIHVLCLKEEAQCQF